MQFSILVVIAFAANCWAAPTDSSDVVQIVSQGPTPVSTYETLFQWKSLDFEFPSDDVRQALLKSGEFIPENNTLAGIKIHDSRVFLTVPRWRKGVPATLVYVDYASSNGTYTTASGNPSGAKFDQSLSSKLKPYPSWEAQKIGDCSAFQYVQSMEIDQFDRMWVIDVGRADTKSYKAETSPEQCPPKLVIINLKTDKIEYSYEFPLGVVDKKKNFLNDLVVGCTSETECIVYITDAWSSRLVMYDFKDKTSWSVTHPTMKATPDAYNVTILGKTYPTEVNIDGIALSPLDTKFSTLYFCPLSSYNLYTIDTASLLKYKKASEPSPIMLKDEEVHLLGRKASHSDGLAMASSGYLYYGQLENNSISYINLSSAATKDPRKPISEVLFIASDIDLQWPDTLAFDNEGYLYTVSNRLQQFISDGYDHDEYNMKVVRTWLGLKSYQHSASDPVVSISIKQAIEGTTTTTTTAATTTTKAPSDDTTAHEHDHDGHDHDSEKPQRDAPMPDSDKPQSLPSVINSATANKDSDKDAKAHANTNILAPTVAILLIAAVRLF